MNPELSYPPGGEDEKGVLSLSTRLLVLSVGGFAEREVGDRRRPYVKGFVKEGRRPASSQMVGDCGGVSPWENGWEFEISEEISSV